MDTEKQRQRRRGDARLTESRNVRSEQLNTRGCYRVANQQSLACLSGSERRRPGWFVDMKYQTCFIMLCKSSKIRTINYVEVKRYFLLSITYILFLDRTCSNLFEAVGEQGAIIELLRSISGEIQ